MWFSEREGLRVQASRDRLSCGAVSGSTSWSGCSGSPRASGGAAVNGEAWMDGILTVSLADGRTKPAAPRVVQYFVPSTGEVLDFCPDTLSHPWPKDEILAYA